LTSLVRVLIASPLEPELVARIAAVDARLEVIYRADQLGQPRYAADHYPPMSRSAEQAAEWAKLLAQAEVLFDVDRPSAGPDLVQRAPCLRWIQSSSSGIGEWVRRLGLVESPVVVTNAAGIHARPLAEYVVFVMLYFAKSWARMLAEQRAHHWERCAIDTIDGKTLGIVGLGRVGQAVAQLAKGLGVRVIGLRRRTDGVDPGIDAVFGPDRLADLLAQSDYVALSLPHTSETVGLIGAAELATMRQGSVLINIARGSIVDESALIEALRSGHLGGAALDVVGREPLAADSPLWDMPNVLITPHSMSTAAVENELLTRLFCDNLRRYLDGQPLLNVFDKRRGY